MLPLLSSWKWEITCETDRFHCVGLGRLLWCLVSVSACWRSSAFWNPGAFLKKYEFGSFHVSGRKVWIHDEGRISMKMVSNLAKSHTVVKEEKSICSLWCPKYASFARPNFFARALYFIDTSTQNLEPTHMFSASYAASTGTSCCCRSDYFSDHDNAHRRREGGCSGVKREYRSMA